MSNNNGHNEAREGIQAFVKRYTSLYPNGDHVELIQLAAFPVAVTVHLLYQIRANFSTYIKNGLSYKIDALAVNDCIQSNLFRQTGPDLFEMDTDVRQCLLEDLRANRGKQFVKDELAAFLYQYSRQNTQGSAWRNYYDAQQWAAIMEVDEKAAAEQILSSLAQELQKKNTSRGLGIVNLIAALEKDNKQFSNLLQKTLNKPETSETEPKGVTSKRIVLTDEAIDGRAPVRINLPPALSKRLERLVRTNPSIPTDEGTNKQVNVYGLFVSFEAGRQQTDKIADILVQKQYINKKYVTILPQSESPDGEIASIRLEINRLLSKATEDDIIILYFNYTGKVSKSMPGKITPGILNDVISRHFPDQRPDIILFIEANSIGTDWFEQADLPFTLIFTANAVSDRNKKGLLENLLNSSDKDITYAQFYDALLLGFTRAYRTAGILKLPHFIPGKPDADQRMFSKVKYHPLEETQKIISDVGRETETGDRLLELTKLLEEGVHDEGREKMISMLRLLFLHQQQQEITCLWLLQNEYDYDFKAIENISSQTALWTDFFDIKESEEARDMLKLVRKLFETQILFIGLTERLLLGLNLVRMKAIINICKARRIILYFIVEEACNWTRLSIREDDVLPPKTLLPDYLKDKGFDAFTELAFKEINEMIRQEEPEKEPGVAYGIFVGVSEYMSQHGNLYEPANDAVKISDTLIQTELLKKDNISLLLNNDATLSGVVSLLETTLKNAKREDTVLFYFSGHAINQPHISALLCYDSDNASEYTSMQENGMLTDTAFNSIIKAAPNDPTIILVLDTHAGSRQWLDENNPKHFCIMATHLEETCYELPGIGGLLTKGLIDCLNKEFDVSYINLYQSVFNSSLTFAHERGKWQTPLFIVHKDHWSDVFLSRIPPFLTKIPRTPKTYDDLQTRDTLHCIYYSETGKEAFTFYNQLKFALHEKRVELEHLDSWSAIDKSLSVHNHFPDLILIGLNESAHRHGPRYNIEKLLLIADIMQIPVYFILEDKSKSDPSIYKNYTLLPEDKEPVIFPDNILKLISELGEIVEPLTRYLKPVEDDYETIAISIGITHYQTLPELPAGVVNSVSFDDWIISGPLKNKVSQENWHTFITSPGVPIQKSDIEETVRRIALKGLKSKQILYIYACGYAPRSTDFLLCLPSWNEKNTFQTVVNIDEYIEVFSHMGFAQIIVFAEYIPLDVTVVARRGIKFEGTAGAPSPSCFFRVDLREYSSSSPILDGLYGGAVNDNNNITTTSLINYLNKRLDQGSSKQSAAQRPQVSIKDTPHTDFTIATLNPSFNHAQNNYNFKQKWLLVVGTGKDSLSQPEWMMSKAIARKLAKSGYGIITGGWPGVDTVTAEAYAAQLAEDQILDEGYLVQVILEKQEPVYPGGLLKRVASEDQWYKTALSQAYAVIMIGGEGGTFISYVKAVEANIPVIPVAATEGDARKAYTVIKERRLLSSYLLDELNKPINNIEDASRTADAICTYLDEGFGKQYYTPNPA